MDKIRYFFRGGQEDYYFKAFGLPHIIHLIIAVAVVMHILKINKGNRKFELFIGFVLLLQQAILYSWYLGANFKVITEGLPFYHCRVAIIALGLGLIFNKELLTKIGAYWGLSGGILAFVVINTDGFYYPHITLFSYFIGHYFLLWGAVYALFVKKIGMSKKDYHFMLKFTTGYHIFIFFVNKALGANYAYMASSPIGFASNWSAIPYALLVITIFNLIITIEYKILDSAFWARLKHCQRGENKL